MCLSACWHIWQGVTCRGLAPSSSKNRELEEISQVLWRHKQPFVCKVPKSGCRSGVSQCWTPFFILTNITHKFVPISLLFASGHGLWWLLTGSSWKALWCLLLLSVAVGISPHACMLQSCCCLTNPWIILVQIDLYLALLFCSLNPSGQLRDKLLFPECYPICK